MVFLGSTSRFSGAGSIFDAFIAPFIIGAINAGMVAAGLTGFWTSVIYGLIIVVAVSLQTVANKRTS